MIKRILLVDDEPLMLKGLKYTLEQEGYETDLAMDGEEALARFHAQSYDLVLLDVMLPKLDGLSVCQRIREKSNVPIIMLTAKGEDMDKILGLEYGADDYMTKPFNILEVRARIRTVLRRAGGASVPAEEGKILRVRDLEVNVLKRTVSTPKLYFYDTGLVCYLTRWTSAETANGSAIARATECIFAMMKAILFSVIMTGSDKNRFLHAVISSIVVHIYKRIL